jgi:hypothetical protein
MEGAAKAFSAKYETCFVRKLTKLVLNHGKTTEGEFSWKC